jgi:hypothetical protein
MMVIHFGFEVFARATKLNFLCAKSAVPASTQLEYVFEEKKRIKNNESNNLKICEACMVTFLAYQQLHFLSFS